MQKYTEAESRANEFIQIAMPRREQYFCRRQKYAEAGSNANKPGTSVHCTARICMRARSSACTGEGGEAQKNKEVHKNKEGDPKVNDF